jgi:hypothetical protein
LRLQRTAANTNTSALYLSQPVETVTSIPLANKQVSFSFYARAGANFSAASSVLNVRLVTGTGTDGNYLAATLTGQAIPLDTTATLTTSFQRFTYSVFVPSGVNQVQPVFFYTPVGTAGAADYFDVTGVQLEQNYSSTPFEQRPIGVETTLCQRYFYQINSAISQRIALGFQETTTGSEVMLPIPVPMRSVPAPTFTGGLCITDGIAFNQAITALTTVYSYNFPVTLGLTHGVVGSVRAPVLLSFTSAGTVALSSEL